MLHAFKEKTKLSIKLFNEKKKQQTTISLFVLQIFFTLCVCVYVWSLFVLHLQKQLFLFCFFNNELWTMYVSSNMPNVFYNVVFMHC